MLSLAFPVNLIYHLTTLLLLINYAISAALVFKLNVGFSAQPRGALTESRGVNGQE